MNKQLTSSFFFFFFFCQIGQLKCQNLNKSNKEGRVRQPTLCHTLILTKSSHSNHHSGLQRGSAKLQAVVEKRDAKYRKLSYGYCGSLKSQLSSICLCQGCLAWWLRACSKMRKYHWGSHSGLPRGLNCLGENFK